MRPWIPALLLTTACAGEATEPEPECLPGGGGPYWIEEGETVTFTVTCATGAPVDGANLMVAPLPAGATWDAAAGRFTWTPQEAHGPGNFTIFVRVTDNGSPSFSDLASFVLTVNEANNAPVLAPIGNKTVDEGDLVTFTASATDGDVPAGSLTFMLGDGAPGAASIDPLTGEFRWRTGETRGPGVYPITIIVADNGNPALSASESIAITVSEVNQPPIFFPLGDQFVVAGTELRFIAAAFDNEEVIA